MLNVRRLLIDLLRLTANLALDAAKPAANGFPEPGDELGELAASLLDWAHLLETRHE